MSKSFALASVLSAATVASLSATSIDGFAELGLDELDGTGAATVDTAPASPLNETAAPAEVAATAAETSARTEVQINDLEYGVLDIIPSRRRGGASTGSKYKFETIAAPVANPNSKSGYDYSYALVTGADGEDEQKLKRSVQSATNQANAQAKKDGTEERYINRQHVVKGVFAGVLIVRVDGTLEEEEGDDA